MINRDNMTFIEHLEALRWALIRVFIVISTVMFSTFGMFQFVGVSGVTVNWHKVIACKEFPVCIEKVSVSEVWFHDEYHVFVFPQNAFLTCISLENELLP